MSAIDLAIAGLALWRISALLSYEMGPKGIFVTFREHFGIVHRPDGRPDSWPDTWIAGVLACVWCLSLNLALPLALVWLLWPEVVRLICLPFALSGIAIIIEKWTDR